MTGINLVAIARTCGLNGVDWGEAVLTMLDRNDFGAISDADREAALRAFLEGQEARHARQVEGWPRLYTTAPAELDGMGTLDEGHAAHDAHGQVWRAARVDPRQLDWQLLRYAAAGARVLSFEDMTAHLANHSAVA